MTPRQTIGLLLAVASLLTLFIYAGWKIAVPVYFLIFANTLLLMPGKGPRPPG